MGELEVLKDVATTAVRRLRSETLSAGQPFMINTNNLPQDQCYLEYPDKSIMLVTYTNSKNEFSPVLKLSAPEGKRLRKRLGLV